MTEVASYLRLFKYYQDLGQKAMDQVDDAGLLFAPDDRSNSIADIVKHLHGNMRSRWTDFLTSDGEKTWRDRDDEFVHSLEDRAAISRIIDLLTSRLFCRTHRGHVTRGQWPIHLT